MMTTIYFAGQDNFGNRGCEALIRSSVKLINEQIPEVKFLVPTREMNKDPAQWPTAEKHHVFFIDAEPVPSMIRWWSRARRFLMKDLDLRPPAYRISTPTQRVIGQSDILIMTGGDIISLDYGLGSLYYWTRLCQSAMDEGKQTVLWAGSVGPFSALPAVEARMRTLLSRFNLITVRETSSFEYLAKLNIKGVELVADPAFCLDGETPPPAELEIFKAGPVLGLNISPIIRKFRHGEESKHALDKEVIAFLTDILRTTAYAVLLIPHVDSLEGIEENSDTAYMEKLLQGLPQSILTSGRIKLVGRGLNAAQLKDVIRYCTVFMGARTHATIAALSQQVPTTSIAYSVKAKGINQDLFGHTRYVLETANVTAVTLRQHFDLLQSEGNEIKDLLNIRLPDWHKRARKSAELLAQLIKKAPA